MPGHCAGETGVVRCGVVLQRLCRSSGGRQCTRLRSSMLPVVSCEGRWACPSRCRLRLTLPADNTKAQKKALKKLHEQGALRVSSSGIRNLVQCSLKPLRPVQPAGSSMCKRAREAPAALLCPKGAARTRLRTSTQRQNLSFLAPRRGGCGGGDALCCSARCATSGRLRGCGPPGGPCTLWGGHSHGAACAGAGL